MMKKTAFSILSIALATGAFASLSPSYSITGTAASELAGFAAGGGNSASGSITLSSVTGGATIERAYLYSNSWFSNPGGDLVFNGNALGGATVTAAGEGDVWGYRWDVTSFVTGNGTYTVDLSNADQIYGAALAVVYSHASLATQTVDLFDGVESLSSNDSASVGFNATAGAATVRVFTQADDPFDRGETLDLNGNVFGGPFDANSGSYASINSYGGTTQNGANLLTMTTNGDYYGWHTAIVEHGAGAVPEPMSMIALGVGILALARRRRS